MVSDQVKRTVIPFGKFAGQTLEQIAGGGFDADGLKYLDWLRGQDWFERKADLYEAVGEYLDDPPIARKLDEALED